MSDLQTIKSSVEAFTTEWEQYKAANEARLAEIEKKGFEPASIKEEFKLRDDKLDEFHESHKALVDEHKAEKERIEALETAIRRPRKDDGEVKSPEEVEHKAALERYLCKGEEGNLRELEQKIINVGSDPDGGYALTPDVEAGILQRHRETSPMRQLARVRSIRSNVWKQKRISSHAVSGGWVSEQATRSTTTTPKLGEVQIDLHEQYAMPNATQQSLDDLDLGVEQWLAEEVEQILMLTENTAYITGTGVGQPRGITTYTDGTDDTAMEVEQIPSGHASQVTAQGLIDLQDALFEPYQANAKYLMRRATRSTIRKLMDGQSNFRLNIDFSTDGAATILGKPVVLCADMPAIGAGNLAIAYGDFRQAYLIVDKPGIRVLRDPYTTKGTVLFYTTRRTGGGIVNAQALKIQDIAAS